MIYIKIIEITKIHKNSLLAAQATKLEKMQEKPVDVIENKDNKDVKDGKEVKETTSPASPSSWFLNRKKRFTVKVNDLGGINLTASQKLSAANGQGLTPGNGGPGVLAGAALTNKHSQLNVNDLQSDNKSNTGRERHLNRDKSSRSSRIPELSI